MRGREEKEEEEAASEREKEQLVSLEENERWNVRGAYKESFSRAVFLNAAERMRTQNSSLFLEKVD